MFWYNSLLIVQLEKFYLWTVTIVSRKSRPSTLDHQILSDYIHQTKIMFIVLIFYDLGMCWGVVL